MRHRIEETGRRVRPMRGGRAVAWRRAALAGIAATGLAGAAGAATLRIEVTNGSAADGLFLTPVLAVFHDGGYSAFTPGTAASRGVEDLAEDGITATEEAGAASAHASAVIANPDGAGPPVDPGETASLTLDVDPVTGRYLSFLSMVIPSNDTFIGNADPLAYRLFDEDGNFTGLGPISVLGGDAWDAGTEVNDLMGAAFNADQSGTSSDEGGAVGPAGDLASLLGQVTAAGTTIGSVPGPGDVLATITVTEVSDPVSVVPLPAGLPLMAGALALLGLARRKRRG